MRVTVERPLVHLCPYRDEIDVGRVVASWDEGGVELHAFAAFLDGLAAVAATHEAITVRIAGWLAEHTFNVEVVTTWSTAGMAVQVAA